MNRIQSAATDAKHLAVAGGISVVAWAGLAWRSHQPGPALLWMVVVMAVAWTALVCLLAKVSSPGTRLTLGFALGFRLLALCAAPVMEDDHWRFLWDGYRFATTGNPYAEAPQARFTDDTIPAEFQQVLDGINHPDVPTIYGPVTQWAFRLAYALAPARLWPWKLILLGAELAVLFLLWPALSPRGRLLLAWCPLAVFETGFNAHPDALALALLIGGWRLAGQARPLASGAALGLAVATKIFAAPLVPFLLWRRGWRAWAMAAAALLALYAPFWLRGGSADLAGLRAMAGEWEFNSSVFALLNALTSRATAQAACAAAFIAIWFALLIRWHKSSPALGLLPPGEWIYGAFLLLSATANPWYVLWLWPFVASRLSTTGVAALAVVSLSYITGLNTGSATLGNFEHPVWLRPLEFGLLALAALRDWHQRKTRP